MIIAWVPAERGLAKHECAADQIPDRAVWIDLVDPTKDEELLTEKRLGLDLPTRAEMQEIEASSRLYREGNAVYMTATLLSKTETDAPEITAVTFIVTREWMVTIRYAEPWSFRTFATRAPKSGITTAEQAFSVLLDTTVERLADLLELVQVELESISQRIFKRKGTNKQVELQRILTRIGTCGGILGKVRESLLDKNRLITFAESAAADWLSPESRSRLKAIQHDIAVLSDHASFNSGKINFLLDATLGMINIGVNEQMKRLSWIMVAVMWPTLVSGFFAMNVLLPFPQQDAHWPFYLCILLAFGPLVVGAWWYWRGQRHRAH
jgi:magnesium transporter